eukprot:m51a1_g13597 hypothetical protein (506) ;mRNA; r:53-2020
MSQRPTYARLSPDDDTDEAAAVRNELLSLQHGGDDDDTRVGVMYAPLPRSRTDNPALYDAVMSFWRTQLRRFVETRSNASTFRLEDARDAFELCGMAPRSLPRVVAALHASHDLVHESELLAPPPSLLRSAASCALWAASSSLCWAWWVVTGRTWSRAASDDALVPGRFLFSGDLSRAGDLLLAQLSKSPAGAALGVALDEDAAEAERAVGRLADCCDIALAHLEKTRRIVRTKCGRGWVVLGDGRPATYRPADRDDAAVLLCESSRSLARREEHMAAAAAEERAKGRKALAGGSRSMAMSHARRAKMADKASEDAAGARERVLSAMDSLQRAETDAQTAASAMREIQGQGATAEAAAETVDVLRELVDQQRGIEDALELTGEPGEADEQTEAELAALERELEAIEEVPAQAAKAAGKLEAEKATTQAAKAAEKVEVEKAATQVTKPAEKVEAEKVATQAEKIAEEKPEPEPEPEAELAEEEPAEEGQRKRDEEAVVKRVAEIAS